MKTEISMKIENLSAGAGNSKFAGAFQEVWAGNGATETG